MRTVILFALLAAPVFAFGCSASGGPGNNGNGGGGGGGGGAGAGADAGDGGTSGDAGPKAALLSNPSVSQTCQTCLAGASTNDCASLAKICSSDSMCTSLNTCVNNCTNLNQGCISNCENTASKNTGTEWVDWFGCACNDCTTQCAGSAGANGSLCAGAAGGGAGGGGGSATVTCVVDTQDHDCNGNQTEYDCSGSDNPMGDGLSASCGGAMQFQGTNDLYYCCN